MRTFDQVVDGTIVGNKELICSIVLHTGKRVHGERSASVRILDLMLFSTSLNPSTAHNRFNVENIQIVVQIKNEDLKPVGDRMRQQFGMRSRP
jgi:hypothetical protein